MTTLGLRALAWRTDVALLEQSGSSVDDRGDHVVVRTPANPGFHWGNFVLLREAPAAGSGEHWLGTFTAAFPDAGHVAIGVDLPRSTRADLEPLAAVGLSPDLSTTLVAAGLAPVPARDDVVVRALATDADWAARTALELDRYPRADETDADHLTFVHRRTAIERSRVERGHGTWWGAFDGEQVLATAGVFTTTGGLARFQDVATHPAAERRGLATAVVTAAGRWATDHGASTLVIVADPDGGAVRLYRRLGFADAEVQAAAHRG